MAEGMEQHEQQRAPGSGQAPGGSVRVCCPACGQPIHVIPVMQAAPSASEPAHAPSQRPVLFMLGRLAYDLARGRRPSLPTRSEAVQEAGDAPPEKLPVWGVIGLIALILVIGIAALWWGRPGQVATLPANTPAPSAVIDATHGEGDAAKTAIIEVLSGYNRAETEAAALLTIEPLLPFIDPTSPFAQQRAAYLAERRQQSAPHRTMLVRWAIGDISVSGTTATAVTQETWSNQEAGAVAAEQATVRVTYTLRKDTPTGRWLIVETSQLQL